MEVFLMKPMIWHPEEKDRKVNKYLETINRAPYVVILALAIAGLLIFSLMTLVQRKLS
jgi:hypothetical protein